MKAEHRKELQTNVLADRMGRIIQRVKTRPSRNTVLTWLLVIVLGLAVLFWIMTSRGRRSQSARLWVDFAGGHLANLAELQQKYPTKEPGKLARFQIAWFQLWEVGIKWIPFRAAMALENVSNAQEMYRKLATDCKDDPVLGPEALYQIAVAEETLAIRDDPKEHLDRAKAAYEEVVAKFPKTARAKDAEQRAKDLNESENPAARRRIQAFYTEMRLHPDILQSLLTERLQQKMQHP
jgi:hypothetical protein